MLIAFVPVLHKGYFDLFKKYPDSLGILGNDVINEYTSLVRDLRVVDPFEMKRAVEGLGIFADVQVLSKVDLSAIADETIAMPDEDISRDIAQKYFADKNVQFEKIFLRWDKQISTTEFVVPPNRSITTEEAHRELISRALLEAEKSADWWRQIGAIIVKDGAVIIERHNSHLPTDFHLVQNGDPRSNFDAGTNTHIYTSIHAEAGAIAECARLGVSLEGASIYTSTFPCPNCARLLSVAGIKKVYYQKGYSLLDAENILKNFGVEIILVT